MPKHKHKAPERSELSDKVALITGGAKRIGASLAKSLHAAGMNVIIHYSSSADQAHKLNDRLNAVRNDSCYLVQCDLLDHTGLKPLIEKSAHNWGRLDVLINNASSFVPNPPGDADESHWDALIGTNLKAPFFLTQAAAPYLREHRGSIINLIDIYADRPLQGHATYCASKAGLASLTRSFAQSLAPDVRVNGIAPGAILWPENQADDAAQKDLISRIPLHRTGEPQNIADAALYLIKNGHYTTGQILTVDGGRTVLP